MDISADYVKMCDKAEEIQKAWQPQVGDWFLDAEDQIKVLGDVVNFYGPSKTAAGPGCGGCSVAFKLKTWLPRQDQLQEMIDRQDNIHLALQGFYKKLESWEGGNFKSFEQLLLGLVMQDKYQKTWNGENWIPL